MDHRRAASCCINLYGRILDIVQSSRDEHLGKHCRRRRQIRAGQVVCDQHMEEQQAERVRGEQTSSLKLLFIRLLVAIVGTLLNFLKIGVDVVWRDRFVGDQVEELLRRKRVDHTLAKEELRDHFAIPLQECERILMVAFDGLRNIYEVQLASVVPVLWNDGR